MTDADIFGFDAGSFTLPALNGDMQIASLNPNALPAQTDQSPAQTYANRITQIHQDDGDYQDPVTKEWFTDSSEIVGSVIVLANAPPGDQSNSGDVQVASGTPVTLPTQYTLTPPDNPNSNKEKTIQTLYPLVGPLAQKNRVPASYVIGIAGLESTWMTSRLAGNGINNIFGQMAPEPLESGETPALQNKSRMESKFPSYTVAVQSWFQKYGADAQITPTPEAFAKKLQDKYAYGYIIPKNGGQPYPDPNYVRDTANTIRSVQ